MAHGDLLKDCDLVPDLLARQHKESAAGIFEDGTDHVFPSRHQSLVDDLRCIIPSSVNVYTLLHD